MGSPKGLLEWRGTTLLEYQMNSLLQGGCDKVVVVTGKYDAEMAPLLKDRPGIIRAYNPKYLEGKTTSIKAGIGSSSDPLTAPSHGSNSANMRPLLKGSALATPSVARTARSTA